MGHTEEEIASQPQVWLRAAETASHAAGLPVPGERVAAVGCGTSWFMAQAYAALREQAGQGETDAFTPSEMPVGRTYDRVLAITRSGTTTETVRLLDDLREAGGPPSTVITAVTDAPAPLAAAEAISLVFADERSIVQTRFATGALALLRAHLGEDLSQVAREAAEVLAAPLPIDPSGFHHFVLLGTGWTVGLAHEGALKLREAAQANAESYPAMEYRHGPISLAGPSSLVWILGTPDPSIAKEVESTGAHARTAQIDPMAELVLIQLSAVALARARGLDPDDPRHLTRSVVLSGKETP